MICKLNDNIVIVESERKQHLKASEVYIHVIFNYSESSWDGWVPIEYRRTRVSIKIGENDDLFSYLNKIYDQMNPKHFKTWLEKQEEFWKEEKSKALITKGFFDALVEGGWRCVKCSLPENSNPARRIQDLKDFGYTIATDTNRYCPKCNKKSTHYILLPIERGGSEGNGYETFSPKLRKRIIRILGGVDAYEGTFSAHCLPDHKFSEIRWEDKGENLDSMSDEEIRAKFQLLTNQRNQQKREVCRNCFQTGKRGIIYGIPFFYAGSSNWDSSIPPKGKEAEKGCIGCAWYDIVEWRNQLIARLEQIIKDN